MGDMTDSVDRNSIQPVDLDTQKDALYVSLQLSEKHGYSRQEQAELLQMLGYLPYDNRLEIIEKSSNVVAAQFDYLVERLKS